MKSKLVLAALAVGKKYPVFPTDNKKPCWSNAELGVGRGEGGYKVATQDPAEIERLFSHPRATEIAVPMGSMSGLLCVDVDTYKDGEDLSKWMSENLHLLENTLTHRTRSGGLHFIFKHPGDEHRFPAQLRPGVDLKAAGNGYICYPPTKGYTVVNKVTAKAFPLALAEEALRARGGSGSTTLRSSYNDLTDDELVSQIQSASVLYPALRSLAFRLPSRKHPGTGRGMTVDEQIQTMHNIMDTSVAADQGHDRHDDWAERRGKIEELVTSANERHDAPEIDAETAALIIADAGGKPFVDPEVMIAAGRPIGPQRETKPQDIEERVAARSTTRKTNGSAPAAGQNEQLYESEDAARLRREAIAPIDWVVPAVLPAGSIASLAGQSNVGKTRFMCAFAMLGAAGKLELMGWPTCPAFTTLVIANEEHLSDLKRRMKAVVLQHGIRKSRDVIVRGKTAGMMRLVALNEVGQPEIDEEAVAQLVRVARASKAKALCLDPYSTLSDAMDENSSISASALTKVFLLLVQLTGMAVFFFHHTPKDRSRDNDWYRADSSAWRGSSGIYGGLDCGYTLSNWIPRDKAARKHWREAWIRLKLGRWIVLDTGKLREGEALPPIIYELVGQEMAPGEGADIGVLRLSSEEEAEAVLLDTALVQITREDLTAALIDHLGAGTYTSLPKVHEKMKASGATWVSQGTWQSDRHGPKLYELLKSTVRISVGTARLKKEESARGRVAYTLTITEKGDTDEDQG